MENNPIITLIYLYNEWSSNKFYFFNFKFSGKYFFEYLENYQRYVTNMENNPIII